MPRVGLTPAIVVEAGGDIADAAGFDGLTLAAVAERLGVALPSLYKHVRGLDALRSAIALRATRDLGDVIAKGAVGKARFDALRAVAAAYRDYGRAHPGRYAATLRSAGTPELADVQAAVLETVLAVLAGYGITGDDAIDATRMLRAMLHGFVSLEAAGGFGMPHDLDRSFDRALEAFGEILTTRSRAEP